MKAQVRQPAGSYNVIYICVFSQPTEVPGPSLSRGPLAPVTVLITLCKACWEGLCPHLTIVAGSSRGHLFIAHPLMSGSVFFQFPPSCGSGGPENSWKKDSLVVNECLF